MYMTKKTTPGKGKHDEGVLDMISELHLELAELLEAGIEPENLEETYRNARERGSNLVTECIRRYPDDYLKIIRAWFGDGEVAA